MFQRSKKICLILLAVIFISGCSKPSDTDMTSAEIHSSNSEVLLSNNNSMGESSMEKYSLESVSFNYPSGVKITENENLVYIHFSDSSFVMAKNSIETYAANMTSSAASEYFDSALESFNTGSWSNAKIETPMYETTLAGIPAWRSVFSSDESNQGPCKIDTVITIVNGRIVSFSFISIDTLYEEQLSTFNALLSTVVAN